MLITVGFKHLKGILLENQIGDTIMEIDEEIIARLKFIGHIQKGEKINVRHVNIQPNNWLTTISRTVIYPDNRMNAITFVRTIITRSFEIIEKCFQSKDHARCTVIMADLIKAQEGLLNLKYTYSDDIKFCCDMEVLRENISSKLNTIQTIHEL